MVPETMFPDEQSMKPVEEKYFFSGKVSPPSHFGPSGLFRRVAAMVGTNNLKESANQFI